MNRSSKAPYDKCTFTPLTDSNAPTFFEKADQELENIVADFVLPVLEDFENCVSELTPHNLNKISREFAKTFLQE